MTDSEMLLSLRAESERIEHTMMELREAGVTAELSQIQASASPYLVSGGWLKTAGPTVYWDLRDASVRIYTLAQDDGLSFEAPTAAGAVALAAENPDMRRWLGLPEPATVIETGGELYEVSVP